MVATMASLDNERLIVCNSTRFPVVSANDYSRCEVWKIAVMLFKLQLANSASFLMYNTVQMHRHAARMWLRSIGRECGHVRLWTLVRRHRPPLPNSEMAKLRSSCKDTVGANITQNKGSAATCRAASAHLLREDVRVVLGLHQRAELAQLPPAGEEHARHVPQELVVRACSGGRAKVSTSSTTAVAVALHR
jgi:hypothetical protein